MKGMLSGYCVCKLLYMRHKLQTCASGIWRLGKVYNYLFNSDASINERTVKNGTVK